MGCCASSPSGPASSDPQDTPNGRLDPHTAARPLRGPSFGSLRHSTTSSRSHNHAITFSKYNQPLKVIVCQPTTKLWTRVELERERVAWFDTRVTGRQEVWSAIKIACESLRDHDVDLAQGLIDAVGATVPTGDLSEGAYDEIGNFYKIPSHIAADPPNLVESSNEDEINKSGVQSEPDQDKAELRREEKGKGVLHSAELITVKARLSDRGGPDVKIAIGKEQNIRVLARRVQEEAGLEQETRVRIAYMGKILKEGETLQDQGWLSGHVVNALVFPS